MKRALLYAICVLIMYAAIAFTVYRFRHMEMTETQLFMHAKDAMLFR